MLKEKKKKENYREAKNLFRLEYIFWVVRRFQGSVRARIKSYKKWSAKCLDESYLDSLCAAIYVRIVKDVSVTHTHTRIHSFIQPCLYAYSVQFAREIFLLPNSYSVRQIYMLIKSVDFQGTSVVRMFYHTNAFWQLTKYLKKKKGNNNIRIYSYCKLIFIGDLSRKKNIHIHTYFHKKIRLRNLHGCFLSFRAN